MFGGGIKRRWEKIGGGECSGKEEVPWSPGPEVGYCYLKIELDSSGPSYFV